MVTPEDLGPDWPTGPDSAHRLSRLSTHSGEATTGTFDPISGVFPLDPERRPTVEPPTTFSGEAMVALMSIESHGAARRVDSTSLSAFLIARIDEEEAAARGCLTSAAPLSSVVHQVLERALDACGTRRRMVAEHATHGDCTCTTLRLLAAAYLERPNLTAVTP